MKNKSKLNNFVKILPFLGKRKWSKNTQQSEVSIFKVTQSIEGYRVSLVGCEHLMWEFWLLLRSTLSSRHLLHVLTHIFAFLSLENLKTCSIFQFRWVFSFIKSLKTAWNTVINLNVLESKSPLPTAFLPSSQLEKEVPECTFPSTASPPLSALTHHTFSWLC